MSLIKLNKTIEKLESALGHIAKELPKGKKVYDFGSGQKDYYAMLAKTALQELKSDVWSLSNLYDTDKSNENPLVELFLLSKELKLDDREKLKQIIGQIKEISKNLKEPKQKDNLEVKVPAKLPLEIRDDVIADINEMLKCFNAECYRSAVIICGRILETCLHRKYFDVTGFDILEKNPGIGLGTLIAKLVEKKVSFDPGITQQIHLINQVRISSVHKKEEAFHPTKQQCHAMILYTMDVAEKLFK